ncbi:hypothetical protein [Trinickia symbiotica]|uniref:Uncharacterized protein n=1 Tax=Trinickia symbiotica TaxID=863227 RepID=A0A2N7XAG9_9BURK|nr:hypothetical protein [Trinickia symbiotica]PMS38455.1 hypothetical protein C0Z20_00790 [Trinickia symbiotica]
MSLFTMPDGSSGIDPTSMDSYGGDPSLYSDSGSSADLSTLNGVTDGSVGSGYDFATGTDASTTSASGGTLGQLQSGSSTINWNQLLTGGLSALVAADSISHGLTASGQSLPVYRAPNGMIYPMGSGPAMYRNGIAPGGGGGFMMLLLLGVIAFAIAKE